MRCVLFAALIFAGFAMTANATEEPDFETVVSDGSIEIRQYDPVIVAETEVSGDMRQASNSGFRVLADYIFGNNKARSEIAMTAPVTRTPSQKIDMTAPVISTPSDEGVWTVSFVMPSKWTMETLPVPNNPAVSIREIPGELLAAIRFSGSGRMEAHRQKQAELEDWIAANGYEVSGPARYAGYDAPWKPAPFRRNEVLIPVEPVAPGN